MTALAITLALPPSANALFKNNPQGGRSKTQAYRKWLEGATYAITMAWREAGHPILRPPLAVHLQLGLSGRVRDTGNCLKPIEDVLVAAIPGMPDDRWNDRIVIDRDNDSVATGAVRVTVSSLPSQTIAPGARSSHPALAELIEPG